MGFWAGIIENFVVFLTFSGFWHFRQFFHQITAGARLKWANFAIFGMGKTIKFIVFLPPKLQLGLDFSAQKSLKYFRHGDT